VWSVGVVLSVPILISYTSVVLLLLLLLLMLLLLLLLFDESTSLHSGCPGLNPEVRLMIMFVGIIVIDCKVSCSVSESRVCQDSTEIFSGL